MVRCLHALLSRPHDRSSIYGGMHAPQVQLLYACVPPARKTVLPADAEGPTAGENREEEDGPMPCTGQSDSTPHMSELKVQTLMAQGMGEGA